MQLHFPSGLPGFETVNRFHIEPLDGAMHKLICDDRSDLWFPIMQLIVAAPDFEFSLTAEVVIALELHNVTDADKWVILHAGEKGLCANLYAPIVVNRRTGRALQIVGDHTESFIFVPIVA